MLPGTQPRVGHTQIHAGIAQPEFDERTLVARLMLRQHRVGTAAGAPPRVSMVAPGASGVLRPATRDRILSQTRGTAAHDGDGARGG